MAAPHKFSHVVYKTHNMDRLIEWYCEVLECRVVHRDDALAFLTYDEEHHRIAIANIGPDPDGTADCTPTIARPGIGVHHVSYTWQTMQELIDVYKRVKAKGIKPVSCLRHGLTLSMYFADPDGNCMEFQVDAISLEDADEFMQGPAFAANPVGEEFDPDELVADFENDAPLADLLLRSDQDKSKTKITVPAH